MNDEAYDDTKLEQLAKELFGMDITIDKVIARGIDVSRTTKATVFLTTKKQLLVYITGSSKLLLADIQKIIVRMGFKAETYFPPVHQPDYFDAIGRDKFRAIFPGRDSLSANDIRYYRTLAPYSPALVQVSEVRDGHIYQYDADASGQWRPTAKFAYRRIKTS